MSVCLSFFLLSPLFLLVFFPPFQQTFIRHQLCMLSRFSRVWLFVTLWTVACQAPLSMGFYGQKYWSGLPFPFLGDLPNPGIAPLSPACPALAGKFFHTSTTGKPKVKHTSILLPQNSTFRIHPRYMKA